MSQPWRKLRAYLVSLKFPQLSYCLEAPASEASGLSGAVTKVFREAGRSRSLGVLPGGFTSATGHMTLENPLVGGMIHLILSQCGWTC
jgi:hypothetical protein